MSARKYFKVKVNKAFIPDAWYANMIGETIEVKRTEWDEGFFEARNGFSVFKHDVTILEEEAA
jgi:hypothetical protein